ncbi:hypothetical protein [Staphylococcus pasteuri]|uniref:hypothetical protein n=1 Tax=Staphylococcus pasteuri TaxID=45972 RepID=UPI002DB900E2|nr:hypothetical protein [Staphylococcus pasteuri]MEB7433802.1 hypothetical protein [Staphylococcus pasteuri]
MEQIKFKTFIESSLDKLENSVNQYLQSDDSANYKLLNITIKETEEHRFPNIEEDFNAVVTLVKNDKN